MDAAVTDYLVKLLKIWPTIDSRYEQDIDAETRRYIKGFADGLNYYAAKHPEQVLEPSMLPITEHDIVAGNMLRHLLFYGFDRTMRELTGSERANRTAHGANLLSPLRLPAQEQLIAFVTRDP